MSSNITIVPVAKPYLLEYNNALTYNQMLHYIILIYVENV